MPDGHAGSISPTAHRWPADADQRRAKKNRLSRRSVRESYNVKLARGHRDRSVFIREHAVVVHATSCISATAPLFASNTVLTKVAGTEHGLKRDEFDEIMGVVDRAELCKTILAKDADAELMAAYTQATGRRFKRVGKIHLPTRIGRSAVKMDELFQHRIAIDWLNLPYDPERFVDYPQIEELYQGWLDEDERLYPL